MPSEENPSSANTGRQVNNPELMINPKKNADCIFFSFTPTLFSFFVVLIVVKQS